MGSIWLSGHCIVQIKVNKALKTRDMQGRVMEEGKMACKTIHCVRIFREHSRHTSTVLGTRDVLRQAFCPNRVKDYIYTHIVTRCCW